jgi:hypothetical protein
VLSAYLYALNNFFKYLQNFTLCLEKFGAIITGLQKKLTREGLKNELRRT